MESRARSSREVRPPVSRSGSFMLTRRNLLKSTLGLTALTLAGCGGSAVVATSSRPARTRPAFRPARDRSNERFRRVAHDVQSCPAIAIRPAPASARVATSRGPRESRHGPRPGPDVMPEPLQAMKAVRVVRSTGGGALLQPKPIASTGQAGRQRPQPVHALSSKPSARSVRTSASCGQASTQARQVAAAIWP